MGQTQTVFLPPWVASTEAEKQNEAEFQEAILKLSTAAANLIAPHPLHEDPEFCFDWVEHRPFAEAAYSGDRRLHRLLPKLVPKRISEEEFWRNYFSHVFAVKRRYELGGGDTAGLTVISDPSANGASSTSAYEVLLATPSSASSTSMLTKTVSYPEKFHLARKYAVEGPPLPNLSDADRILLEALQQQATLGECNRPRPGMWDTTEEKAKYEAWKKLGTMAKAEAMHLYVQAIEVFDEHWIEWPGLQEAVAAAVGAVTPVTNGAARAAPDGGKKIDMAGTVGGMRQLRASLDRLPATQLSILRDECDAMTRAVETAIKKQQPATR
uniref:BSD domain-containing protein n=1 Tax=Haptolina brevifila TaxID=156173 RepID=A0A7S2IID8_9EUKA|mmetsp:Transcript_66490/g.131827  ORF Transcript_66490/g.131827 Transcript_66490/m.131827 type:complete len:326 (+) Transcript_66490:125-1102(+)